MNLDASFVLVSVIERLPMDKLYGLNRRRQGCIDYYVFEVSEMYISIRGQKQ